MRISKKLPLSPRALAFCATVVLAALAGATPAVAAGPGWTIRMVARPTVFVAQGTEPVGEGYVIYVTNMSGHEAAAGTTITLNPDSELEVNQAFAYDLRTEEGVSTVGEVTCAGGPDPACTDPNPVGAYDTIEMQAPVSASRALAAKVADVVSSASVEGGGEGFSTVSTGAVATPVGAPAASFGLQGAFMEALNGEGGTDSLAGDRPAALTSGFAVNTYRSETSGEGQHETIISRNNPDSTTLNNARQVSFTLPLGLIGNPQAVAKCPISDLVKRPSYEEEVAAEEARREGDLEPMAETLTRCPRASRIGSIVIEGNGPNESSISGDHEISYVYNMAPEPGFPVEFGFSYFNRSIVLHGAVVDTPRGYTVKVSSLIPDTFAIEGVYLTVFGDPADAVAAIAKEAPPAGASAAFLRNPTTCGSGVLSATVEAESWEAPGVHPPVTTPVFANGLSGCGALQFNSTIESTPVGPLARVADSPSGYAVTLKTPQEPDLTGYPSSSDLRNATVVLPGGVVLSPGAGSGLQACTASQFYTEGQSGETKPAACPEASQVGEAELRTPLLEESIQPLKGRVYVAQPECDPCTAADAQDGKLLHLYVQVEAPSVGVYLKLAGTGSLNPVTGQITTMFRENPQLPFTEFKLTLHGGTTAPLSTPQACGSYTTASVLEPWSAPATPNATPSSVFAISEGCAGSTLFAPLFSAGTTMPLAGAYTPFTLTLTRQDREQDLSGIATTLPAGLLAAIAHVPLCAEPAAREGQCPVASRLGSVHVSAGSGQAPLWETGSVYLTGPYEGAPFGLSVVVPAVAGPFNLGNVVVQAAISINPATAVVSVKSAPLPQVVAGVPLRVKTVNITLERPEFTLNPTSCSQQAVTGVVSSAQGASASVSSSFAVAGCGSLPFNPGFTASTAGKASKANGASLTVKVVSKGGPQPGEEANIKSVKVDLPNQLPSRLSTLQKACTEAQFNANPAGCPAASNVGTATAATPILSQPLTGPAYLVSHGGAAFPDLEIILQGEGVTLILDGNTAIKNGITSSTFKTVPDAPISSFELKLPTGQFSVLGANVPASANYSLCGQTLAMPTAITAQNGTVIKQTTKITVTGCAKVKKKSLTRAQKLKAALKACKKKAKGQRARCEGKARKAYGSVKRTKK